MFILRWIDRIWLGLLVLLFFFSPLLMFRENGQAIIKEIAPDLITVPHSVPVLTNLVVKEIFCQSIILILLYLTLAKKALTGNWKFTHSRLDMPIFSLLFISAISLSYSHTWEISSRDWGLFATFILFYYLILDQLCEPQKIRLILWTVVASAIVTAFFATCQHLERYPFDFIQMILGKAEDRNRMSATVGHNNGVASQLMLASFVLIALRFSKPPKTYRFQDTGKRYILNLLQIALLIWFLFVIMATLSRGVWIGTTVGFVLLLGYLVKELGAIKLLKANRVKMVIGLISFCIFFAILSIPGKLNPIGISIVQRLKDTLLRKETYIQDDRLRMWASSFEMIKDHPLRGVSLGAFKYWVPLYQGKFFEEHPNSKLEPTYKLTNESHNEYIQTWTEMGILGFFISLWLLFKYLSIGFKGFKIQNTGNQRPETKNLRIVFFICLFCATVGILCQSLVDFPLHVAPLALLFIFLGALVVNQENIGVTSASTIQPLSSVGDLQTSAKVSYRAKFWLVSLVIIILETLNFESIELRADWYKNRMDYFLDAFTGLRAGGYADLSQYALMKAELYGEKSVALDSHNGRTHYDMGLGYWYLHQPSQAIEQFQLSLRDMEYADMHFFLGDAYESEMNRYKAIGDSADAIMSMDSAMENYRLVEYIYPLNHKFILQFHDSNQPYYSSEALHRLGGLYYQQGKKEQALAVWRKIVQKDPFYLEEKFYNVSRQHLDLKDFKTAIEILQNAYALDTANPETWKRLGGTYFQSGQYNDTLPWLDKLHKKYPANPVFTLGYARVYDKLHDKQKALDWIKQTLALDSSRPEALDILRRLGEK